MSFRLIYPLPEKCLVAVSGGVDSMAALNFLAKVDGRVASVIHIHHNTGEFADRAMAHVLETCREMNLKFHLTKIDQSPPEGESKEKFWRDQRYLIYEGASRSFGGLPVVLAHTLDDCLETYVKTVLIDGYLGTIPYRHGPCVRPFRFWKREEILSYAAQKALTWVEDPSNENTCFQRNFIRHKLVPVIKKLNPGVYNVVERAIRLQDEYNEEKMYCLRERKEFTSLWALQDQEAWAVEQ